MNYEYYMKIHKEFVCRYQ